MNELQLTAIKKTIKGKLVLGASAASVPVDMSTSNYAEFVFDLGETDTDLTTLKVVESDSLDTDGSLLSPTDVVAATTLPTATDDGKLWVFGISRSAPRKKYAGLVATVGAGAQGAVGAIISCNVHFGRQIIGSSLASNRQVKEAKYI